MNKRVSAFSHKYRSDKAFTLLEIMVALVVFSIVSMITIPVGLRLITWQRLSETTDLLTNRMRLAQSESQIHAVSSMVDFAPYQPFYTLRTASTIEGNYGFSPGIMYKDGRLQLSSTRVAYGMNGNSEVSGVIRLAAGKDELDIKLYLGGLSERTGVLP